jgi:hypothetical protein
MRKFFWLTFMLGAIVFFPLNSHAYPELVRYGYVNCVSCHVSPTGGGVLNQYGREASREILSTWGIDNEKESQFAYGVVQPPDWLDLMGEYRGVYAYQNTPFISQGEYIYMQGDAEAAVVYKKLFVDATLGYENKLADNTLLEHLISRRNYIGYYTTENSEVRFGRFYPQFGIYTPDHTLSIKRALGWDEGQESYNLETAYLGERFNLYITGDFGRIDNPSLHTEQGLAIQPSLAVDDTDKLGVSYFYGNAQTTTRNVVGPFGIFGFTHHFFLLSELDFQGLAQKDNSAPTTWGLVDYQRLDYELVQGFHVFLTQDLSRLNFSDSNTLTNAWGVGVQFFPRPHFEILATYQKLENVAIAHQYTDYAYLTFNIYL